VILKGGKLGEKRGSTNLRGNTLAAVLAFDRVLDDRVAGIERFIQKRDAVEGEANAQEVDYFVKECPTFL